jgi:O-antigen/teichoic acid export membrane protein
MLMGIASVPLTVHYLGPERYGVWLTISSLLVWVALTDFGLAGNALVNVLSEAVGNDDRESARHYAASAFWALVTIALVIGVVLRSLSIPSPGEQFSACQMRPRARNWRPPALWC